MGTYVSIHGFEIPMYHCMKIRHSIREVLVLKENFKDITKSGSGNLKEIAKYLSMEIYNRSSQEIFFEYMAIVYPQFWIQSNQDSPRYFHYKLNVLVKLFLKSVK